MTELPSIINAAPPITIVGNRLQVHFTAFDSLVYELFKKVKRLPEYEIDFVPEGETYRISAPARFAPMLGVPTPAAELPPLPIPPAMFDDQRFILQLAIGAQRFAVWSDCGLGKSFIEWEWCRQVAHMTGGKVLLITLNDIVPGLLAEARKFYGEDLRIRRINSRDELREWCASTAPGDEQIAITNYEKMNPDDEETGLLHETRNLAGRCLDSMNPRG
jgi:hypothetical protein